jgi:hypothetical protein
MSFTSISRAAIDQDLINRVSSAAHQIAQTDDDKANTLLGQQLINGNGMIGNPVASLMWPVAIDTEQAYESALLNQRGAPGFDVDIITDAAIFASVNAHWPMQRPPTVGV